MPKSDFAKNWGVVGHQNVVDFLKISIKNNQVSHAYLLHGQAGLGKKKIARNFIDALLCPHQINGLACQKCVNCQQLEKNIHPDVIQIERLRDEKSEKLKKNITIEQIREIKNKLTKGAFLNSYKIALIREAELMSLEASNALLKLLEEPATKVVIILIASNIKNLPETILSRCQKLKLESVKRELIYNYLINLGSSRNLANELSYLANGRPGLAIKYYRDKELFDCYQEKVTEFLKLVKDNNLTKIKTIEDLNKQKKDLISKTKYLSEILDIWASVIRDVILLKNNRQEVPSGLINFWLLNQLKTAKLVTEDSQKLNYWLELINKTKLLFKNNINPQLALESLVLNFS